MKARPTGPSVYVDTYRNRHGEVRAQVTLDMTTLGKILAGDAGMVALLAERLRDLSGVVSQYQAEGKRAWAAMQDPSGCQHPERAISRDVDGRMSCLACGLDLNAEVAS